MNHTEHWYRNKLESWYTHTRTEYLSFDQCPFRHAYRTCKGGCNQQQQQKRQIRFTVFELFHIWVIYVIYLIELEIKDITYTVRYASYLDLLLEIDNEARLRTKLYENRFYFNFPIMNFDIYSIIPVVHTYGVYISQLIRYSRVCSSYHDLLSTSKILNQGFLLVRLKSSLANHYGVSA